jgi:pimeloyl-ACP methyl ester carboxylesterase
VDCAGRVSRPRLIRSPLEHGHLSDAAAERLRVLPNVRLAVVPAATHNVMTDNPIPFRHEVGHFLAITEL